MNSGVRADKFLWAIRLFKTRGLAADACAFEKVRINNQPLKASRILHPGDCFSVKFGAFERTFKILELVKNRQPASKVSTFCEETTPPSTIEAMKTFAAQRAAWREPGLGRPTKKERRELDDFMDWEDWP